jgi:CheY-like chemotaxis protein
MPQILIVDDEPETCRVMSRLFARRGWTSAAVHDGADALAAVRSDRPDAVLLDVMMPGMDGFEVLAAIRADVGVGGVPVLFYSARHDQATVERALAAGADDYITKLTSAAQVCRRVGLFVGEAVAAL